MTINLKDPKERGRQLLEDILSEFPEAERATERTRWTERAIIKLGENGLRQDEFSRLADEARQKAEKSTTYYTELTEWQRQEKERLAQEKREVEERLAGMGGGGGGTINPDGTPGSKGQPADLSGYVRKEEVDKLVRESTTQSQAFATNFAAFSSTLSSQHFKEFGEPLDMAEALTHCRTKGLLIDRGGYEDFVKGRRDEARQKQNEQALKDAEERGYQRAQRESIATPFGIGPGEAEGTLAGLKTKERKSSADSVAAATQTFNELRARRGA